MIDMNGFGFEPNNHGTPFVSGTVEIICEFF
jgi:hypothetical protein